MFHLIQYEFIQRNMFHMMNDDLTPESPDAPGEEGVVAVRRAMRILEAFGVEDPICRWRN